MEANLLPINTSTLFSLLELNFSWTFFTKSRRRRGRKKAGTASARILSWRDGGGRQTVKHSHSVLNCKEPRLLNAWDGGTKYCLHDAGVPSPLTIYSLWIFHRTPSAPKARENAWLVLAIFCMFCFPKPLNQIKWTEKSSILNMSMARPLADEPVLPSYTLWWRWSICWWRGITAGTATPAPEQRQRESSSAGFCQHSNVKWKVWSCHTPSWYSHGSRTL